MSFTSLGWQGASGRDLHLLPGLVGPNLRQLLDFSTTDPDDDPDTLTVTFSHSFDADEAAVGVTVDENTGEVTVADPFPPPPPPDGPLPTLHFFIIEVEATDGADVHLHTRIRVQIHQSITSMWLTPSPLTVRVGTDDVRFSVLAQFDDGSIGDISTWSPFITPGSDELTFVHADGEDTPVLEWSAEGDGITVSADTGQLDCSDETATGVRVSATINAPGAPAPATGEARGGPSWSTPVRLAHVHGPGYKAMMRDDVHNILFLPDGFVASERDAYETLVMGIVNLLSVMPHTRPFDILGKRLNYFTAWVPSPAAGCSPLFEMSRITQAGTNATGLRVPRPTPPPEDPDDLLPVLTLRQLINTVGLPLPNRDHPGDPLGDENHGNLHDWLQLYDSPEDSQVDPAVYSDWLALTSRVLLNETDTAFTVCAGDRPTANPDTVPSMMQFHPLRGMGDDLDTFLKALQDEDGNPIPDVWSTGSADDTLVVFLSRCMFGTGSNNSRGKGARYIAKSLDDQILVPMRQNPTNGWDFVAEPIPDKASVDMWTATAHELGHSFQLEDEYGGSGEIPEEEVPKLAKKPNVQAASDLGVPTSTVGIKWRWPRIKRAGILAADVADASGIGAGPFTLTLQPGHGESFAKDDFARLRPRKLLGASMSSRIRITAVTGDTLKAAAIPGEAFLPSEWKAGSVVIVPQREKDPHFPDVLGDDQLLIAAKTLAQMDRFHNPLNMLESDRPDLVSTKKLPVPTPATLFPNGKAPKPPDFSSWYVGLFDNGDTWDTGVYRPTGICLMSKDHFIDLSTGIDVAYQFCPVCRYWLVDLIDPSQHRWIDIDFEPRYPK